MPAGCSQGRRVRVAVSSPWPEASKSCLRGRGGSSCHGCRGPGLGEFPWGVPPRMGGSLPYCRDPGYDGSKVRFPGGRVGTGAERGAPFRPRPLLRLWGLSPPLLLPHDGPHGPHCWQHPNHAECWAARVLRAALCPLDTSAACPLLPPVWGVTVADQGPAGRCLGLGNGDGTGGWCGWGH